MAAMANPLNAVPAGPLDGRLDTESAFSIKSLETLTIDLASAQADAAVNAEVNAILKTLGYQPHN